jgi:hypothetical protein
MGTREEIEDADLLVLHPVDSLGEQDVSGTAEHDGEGLR